MGFLTPWSARTELRTSMDGRRSSQEDRKMLLDYANRLDVEFLAKSPKKERSSVRGKNR